MVQDVGDLEEAEARDNGLVRWALSRGVKEGSSKSKANAGSLRPTVADRLSVAQTVPNLHLMGK
jgi:hypothetical protein